MAFIHVIIPCYNVEKYLEQAVYSVLNQPCKEIDIVLVDDGSPGRTPQLCDEIAAKEERVHVIHKPNGGVSSARNTGIEYILNNPCCDKREFLAFLDGDDVWAPDIFDEELCARLRREADMDIFAFGSCTSNGDVTKFSHPCRYEDHRLEGGNDCIWKTQGTFCANLYRVDLLHKYGIRFAEGLKYSEDKIFLLQCVFLARYVRFLPQILHIYRNNSSSAMKQVFSSAPIDYYIPIIDGWVASDRFLNGLSDQTGRSTKAGAILAGIYFMDMAQEHFERWHRPARLYEVFRSHPDYHLFENMNPRDVSAVQYANHNLLLGHPLRYRLRNNAVGAVKFFVRLLLQLKPIRELRDSRRYPLTRIPR